MDKSERIIFVFGSNLAGRHGAGAARWALDNKGAIYGQGVGMQGDSYGIPTKDENIETLPLDRIKVFVNYFLEYAKNHPHMTFQLTPIGCGLAGYKPYQIAPMFECYTENVMIPEEFKPYLVREHIGYIEREEGYYKLYAPVKGSVVTQAFIMCKYCGGSIYHCMGPKYDAVCFDCYDKEPELR